MPLQVLKPREQPRTVLALEAFLLPRLCLCSWLDSSTSIHGGVASAKDRDWSRWADCTFGVTLEWKYVSFDVVLWNPGKSARQCGEMAGLG